MHALSVDLADRSYPVLVGPGARHELRFVPAAARAAVIVTQQSIMDAGWIEGLDPGVPFEVCVIPDGEDAKTLATSRSWPASSPTPACRERTSSSPSAAAS